MTTASFATKVMDPSIRSQIDAFIASGRHKVLPTTDSRLLPSRRTLDWDSLTPNADATTVLNASRSSRKTQIATQAARTTEQGLPPASYVVTHVGPCEAAPGSKRAARYLIWKVGATIGELRAAGLRLSDYRRDVDAGRVTVAPTMNPTT